METTIGIIGYILVLYWDNGKGNGNWNLQMGSRVGPALTQVGLYYMYPSVSASIYLPSMASGGRLD